MKRLRGWEPVTTYEHRDGVLASSRPEVEWDEVEAAWMLALRQYREALCPGCGGNLLVTAAPQNEDRFPPELPLQCFRCVGSAQSHEAYVDHPHPTSLLHRIPLAPIRP